MTNVFVYFQLQPNSLIGDIKGVSPTRITELEKYDVCSVPINTVERILDGTHSPVYYQVVIAEFERPTVKLREEFGESANMMVPFLFRIPRKAIAGADITFTLNYKQSSYHIEMGKPLKTRLEYDPNMIGGTHIPRSLHFYIVFEDNPSILFDKVTVLVPDLAETAVMTTPAVKTLHFPIAVMTPKILSTYSLGIEK